MGHAHVLTDPSSNLLPGGEGYDYSPSEAAISRSYPQTELPPRQLEAVLLYFQSGELDYWQGSYMERVPLDDTGTPFIDAPDDP